MFTYFFRGGMSEYVAPRPAKTSEIWSYLKSGQYDRAVDAIRESGKTFNVNCLDPATGLAPLHIVSAAGHLELVVELLSQGALVSAMDTNGNNSLHLAALNNHKGVVEVLLRYGADPSVPTGKGILPVELTTNKFVRELFFRDQMCIFSPVVQAHSLFNEYLTQSTQNVAHQVLQPVRLKKEFSSSSNSDNGSAIPSSNSVSVDLVKETIISPMKPSEQPQNQGPFMSPSLSQLQKNFAMKNATSTPSLPYSFNFNCASSSKMQPLSNKRQAKAFPQWQSSSFSSPSHILDQSYGPMVSESEELQKAVLQAAAETALVAQISSADFNRRFELVRQIQDKKIPALTKSLERDPSLAVCRLSDMGGLVTDGFTPFHVAAQCDNVEALKLLLQCSREIPSELYSGDNNGCSMVCWLRDLQGRTPLHIAAMHNAVAAASWLRNQMRSERNNVGNITNNSHYDLSELHSQETDKDNNTTIGKEGRWSSSIEKPSNDFSPNDPVGHNAPVDLSGLTPLGCGKVAASKRRANPLSSDMQRTLFSPGDRSVLPRTPKAGKSVGPNRHKINASSLFSSPTPLRYHYQCSLNNGYSDGNNEESSEKIIAYSADCPPPTHVNLSESIVSTDDIHTTNMSLVYAVGEAQGWTNGMEDRHFCLCPLASQLTSITPSSAAYTMSTNKTRHQLDNEPQWKHWCFYGVLDGHGGSFSSDFLSRCLPETLYDTLQNNGKTEQPICDTVDEVTGLLEHVCRTADRALAAERRMTVISNLRNKQISAIDTSGSTGIFLMVTQSLLVVANVGDCRAVLARHAIQEDSTGVIEAVELSRDHKPSLPEEQVRITASGLSATALTGNESVYEIADAERCPGHKLRVSRAFGDFFFKQYYPVDINEASEKNSIDTVLSIYDKDDDLWRRQTVTACPEVRVLSRNFETDLFVVLACDGVWDVMSSQDAVDFISNRLQSQQSESNNENTAPETHSATNWIQNIDEEQVADACDSLLVECLKRGSRDNMTVFLVVFQPQAQQHTAREQNMAGSTDISLLPFENPALLVHNASYNSSASIHDVNGSNSTSRSPSVSPRLQHAHYHTDHILPLPTPTMSKCSGSSNSSRNSSPTASKVGTDGVSVVSVNRRPSYVRDPTLCEVDVSQPPASVLLYTKQSAQTSSLRSISESSPLQQQHPSTPPPPPLSDGGEPGIMSPLYSAPRSGLRHTSGSNSQKAVKKEDDGFVVGDDDDVRKDEGDLIEKFPRVERQLHF